eukprot:g11080.t1
MILETMAGKALTESQDQAEVFDAEKSQSKEIKVPTESQASQEFKKFQDEEREEKLQDSKTAVEPPRKSKRQADSREVDAKAASPQEGKGGPKGVQSTASLLKYLDKKDKNYMTALMLACQNGHTQVAKVLLDYKADTKVKIPKTSNAKETGRDALMLACANGYARVAELLVNHETKEHGKESATRLVNDADNDMFTPMMLASSEAEESSEHGKDDDASVSRDSDSKLDYPSRLSSPSHQENHEIDINPGEYNELQGEYNEVHSPVFTSRSLSPVSNSRLIANRPSSSRPSVSQPPSPRHLNSPTSAPQSPSLSSSGSRSLMLAVPSNSPRSASSAIKRESKGEETNYLSSPATPSKGRERRFTDAWPFSKPHKTKSRSNSEAPSLAEDSPTTKAADRRLTETQGNKGDDRDCKDAVGVLEVLVLRKARLDEENKNGDTALKLAARSNKSKVVKLLYESKAQLWNSNGVKSSALLAALEANSRFAVDVLMEATNQNGRTALLQAAYTGEVPELDKLLNYGANIHAHDEDNRTALMLASENDQSEAAKMLIEHLEKNELQDYLKLTDKNDRTALLIALDKRNFATLETLNDRTEYSKSLENALFEAIKMDDNKEGGSSSSQAVSIFLRRKDSAMFFHAKKDGQTPLFFALGMNNLGALRVLANKALEVGEEPRDEKGNTALMLAATKGNEKAIDVLCNEKSMNACTNECMTALMFAVQFCHISTLQALVQRRASLSAKDADGRIRTALWIALKHQQNSALEELIKHDAVVDVVNVVHEDTRLTPLMHAALQGPKEAVELLLSKADKEARDEKGRTALMLVSKEGSVAKKRSTEVLELLIRKKASVDARDGDGRTAVVLAALGNNHNVIDLLGKNGADLMEVMLVIFHDKEAKSFSIFEALAKAGADVNGDALKSADMNAPRTGLTFLMVASRDGKEGAVKGLLNAKADVARMDARKETALMLACKEGHCNVVELLVAGPGGYETLEARNEQGRTAIMLAALATKAPVVKVLLGKTASLETEDNENKTAVQIALDEEKQDALRVLAENKADLERASNEGRTLLMTKAEEGNTKLVQWLLAVGANAESKDCKELRTALMLAAISDKVDVVKELLTAKANSEAKDKVA